MWTVPIAPVNSFAGVKDKDFEMGVAELCAAARPAGPVPRIVTSYIGSMFVEVSQKEVLSCAG
jgi:hypothetical protein